MKKEQEIVKQVDRIPDSIRRASVIVEKEEAWMHIDDFVGWLESSAKKILPEGEKTGHIEHMGIDGSSMVIRLPGLHGKPSKTVYAEPMFTDAHHVLYGFRFSYQGDNADEHRIEPFVMPEDIIAMIPHDARDDEGMYPFSLEAFVRGINERTTPRD